jgi:hypothetical protein
LQVAEPLQPKLFGQLIGAQAPAVSQVPLQLLVRGFGGQSVRQQSMAQMPDWQAWGAVLVDVAAQGLPGPSFTAQAWLLQKPSLAHSPPSAVQEAKQLTVAGSQT